MIEQEKITIEENRLLRLLDLRFDIEQADELCEIPDVVHEARRLLALGCPHRLVVKILS